MLSRGRRLLIAGGVIVATLGWWWMRRPPLVTAQLATVTSGPLRTTVDEMGTTRVRAHTDINAPTNGRWSPAPWREGDVVQAGERLGVLYPAPMDAAAQAQAVAQVGRAAALVREAAAQVTAARTALDEARRAHQRAESLGAVGGVAPQEVERARDAVALRESEWQGAEERLRMARYERAQAEAALAGARGNAGGIPLLAPLTATVLAVAEPHERVLPAGTRLLEIGDPRDIEVVVPLLTADALRVQDGAAVRLTFGAAGTTADESPRDTVLGRVQRIEPAAFTRLSALGVEEQRVNVVVSVPAVAVHLGDRFRADARITVWESPRTLRVPTSALVRDAEGWRVWRVHRGRAVRQPVRLGERGDALAEVRDGLGAGDTVVVFPGEQLAPGVRITAR